VPDRSSVEEGDDALGLEVLVEGIQPAAEYDRLLDWPSVGL